MNFEISGEMDLIRKCVFPPPGQHQQEPGLGRLKISMKHNVIHKCKYK